MKKWKTILCGVIAVMMAAALPVQAAAVDLEAKYVIETNNIPPWPKAQDVMADTAVLMEAGTGTILYDKGANEKRYPASITKIMTLLVAAENGNFDDQVTFTETGVRDVTPDSGNIGMQLGETMSLRDCVNAMIIYSANEVSAQIAEYVGGTEAHFIEMMNAKAKELGCKNTNFTNASGLPDTNQYTTARDMALIYRAGLKNAEFRKVMRTRAYAIEPTNLNPERRVLTTHHPLLSELSSLYDPDCIGGKSGMTNDAGNTLVTGMKKDGVILIAVVLRDVDINQAGVDTKTLFDYGYGLFQRLSVEGGAVVIPKTMTLAELTVKEKEAGTKVRQNYYVADHSVGRGSKTLATPTPEAVQEPEAQVSETDNVQGVREELQEEGLSDTAKFLLAVMAGMFVLLIILCIILAVKEHKKYGRR